MLVECKWIRQMFVECKCHKIVVILFRIEIVHEQSNKQVKKKCSNKIRPILIV